jgi:hypothetical protein
MRFRFANIFKILLLVSIIFAASIVLLGGHKAAALGDNYPPGNSADNDWILLSNYQCPGHCLNTPTADIRVYYNIATLNAEGVGGGTQLRVNVQIDCRYNGTPNGSANLDRGTSSPNWPFVTCTGLNTNTGSNTSSFNVTRNNLNCSESGAGQRYTGWCFTTLHLNLNATPGNEPIVAAWVYSADDLGNAKVTPEEELSPGQNYTNTDCYQGYEFSFNGDNKTCTPPGGLAQADNLFTLWNNFNSNGPGTHHTWQMHFGPDCTVTAAKTVYLRWYDADDPGIGNSNGTQSNGGTADTSLNMDLFDNTTGQYIFQNATNLGGNDSYRDRSFTVRPNHNYTWTWNNVSATNGIQLWMPYSEMGTVIDCTQGGGGPPPNSWTLDATSTVTNAANGAPISVVTTKKGIPGVAQVKFNHIIHNFGPNAANYNFQVMGQYTNRGWGNRNCGNSTTTEPTTFNDTGANVGLCPQQPTGGTNFLSYGTINGAALGDSRDHSEEYQFPSTAAPGDTYCQYISFSNPTGPGSSTGGGSGPFAPTVSWGDDSDAPACVTYNPFYINLNSVSCTDISITANKSYFVRIDNLTTGTSVNKGPYAGSQDPNPFLAWPDVMFPHDQYNFYLLDASNGAVADGPNQLDKCMSASCSPNLQVSGDYVEPGQPANLGYGINITNNTSAGFTQYGAVVTANPGLSMPPAVINNPFPAGATVYEGGNWNVTADYQGNLHAVLTFNGTDISSLFGGLPCDSNTYAPLTRPTMRVTNGDIATGGGFAYQGACTPTATFTGSTATRYVSPVNNGNNNNAGSLRTFSVPISRKGSGADFAAYALGYIDGTAGGAYGFFSAGKSTSSNNYDSLMFANIGVASSTNLGGELGGDFYDAHCSTDYFNSTRLGPLTLKTQGDVALGGYNSNSSPPQVLLQKPNGQSCLRISGLVNPGVRLTIYTSDDVCITDNITYAAWNFDTTNYTNSAPYLTVITQGSIYVQPNVTTMTGLFIAQPEDDGTKGVFATCGNDNTPADPAFIKASCQNHLTVKGSVIAQHVFPLRVGDTLSQYVDPTSSSELFDYVPSNVVAQPNFAPSTGGAATPGSLDSLINLPPVF